jgi:hypothetical protein
MESVIMERLLNAFHYLRSGSLPLEPTTINIWSSQFAQVDSGARIVSAESK